MNCSMPVGKSQEGGNIVTELPVGKESELMLLLGVMLGMRLAFILLGKPMKGSYG